MSQIRSSHVGIFGAIILGCPHLLFPPADGTVGPRGMTGSTLTRPCPGQGNRIITKERSMNSVILVLAMSAGQGPAGGPSPAQQYTPGLPAASVWPAAGPVSAQPPSLPAA